MGHFDSSIRDGRGEVGNLSDRFAGLNVRDYSSAESLFQVMKAVEDAEITIREQLEENDRLKGEILQKNHELEKYIAVCYGQSTEFSIQGSDGVEHLLRTSSSSWLRDTIVLTLRLFKLRAVHTKKKGFFK